MAKRFSRVRLGRSGQRSKYEFPALAGLVFREPGWAGLGNLKRHHYLTVELRYGFH